MKKVLFAMVVFCFLCVEAFADVYRLIDAPDRCVVDYNDENHILDFSQCDPAKDHYVGDRSFHASVYCSVRNVDLLWFSFILNVESIGDENISNYYELTERTNYSCEVKSVTLMDSTISIEKFDSALRYDQMRRCYLVLEGKSSVRRISSYEYSQKNVETKSHCATYSIEEEFYLMQACVNSCLSQNGSNIVEACAKRLKDFECKYRLDYRDAKYKGSSCPVNNLPL